MKTIYGLEPHTYAPELNKVRYTDDTYDKVPGCTTIDEARQHIAKYNVNDNKRYAGYKLNTNTKR